MTTTNAADPKGFAEWACDRARTREERYGAERIIATAVGFWRHKHGVKPEREYNAEAERLARKERQLNPAYEPAFSAEDAARAEEAMPLLENLSFTDWDDRPLRDVGFLRFCPALRSMSCYSTEVRDWSPVAAVAGTLRELRIADKEARDLRGFGALTGLETLHVTAYCPWPELGGWEGLGALRDFEYHGNILALTAVPRLAGVRAAKIHQLKDFHVPVRRVADLPEMPELRRLHLENAWQLDGMERYPHLLNLEVYGYFDDLGPLTALRELTHLFLSGGDYPSLAPLASLPELRRVTVRRDEPQDLSPLAELPRLHEVAVELAPGSRLEAATLNAALTPWAETFAVHPPRPLAPLRLIHERRVRQVRPTMHGEARDWGEDKAMGESEARWFAREINRRLRVLLGRGWGKAQERYGLDAGAETVELTRQEDIDRLGEVVATLRGLLAETRYPWKLWVHVDSLARYERGLAEIEEDDDDGDDDDAEEFDAESERQNWEYRQAQRRERREYLEREYRFRLQQEQGAPIRPEDFAPPREEPEEPAGAGGGEDPGYDLGTRMALYATLTEEAFFVREHDRGLAELLLDVKAEPPPPEEEEDDEED